jgi:DNA-binding XRE family transcriptional regulator
MDQLGRGASPKYTHVGCVRFRAFLVVWQAVLGNKQLKILGATIRHYRKEAGISQETLAERAGLHPVYVGKVERGEQWISLHALLGVAKALRVPPAELLREL